MSCRLLGLEAAFSSKEHQVQMYIDSIKMDFSEYRFDRGQFGSVGCHMF